MIVYPAIDISKGEIVRLTKGDFSRKKIYKKNIKYKNFFVTNGTKIWSNSFRPLLLLNLALSSKNELSFLFIKL